MNVGKVYDNFYSSKLPSFIDTGGVLKFVIVRLSVFFEYAISIPVNQLLYVNNLFYISKSAFKIKNKNIFGQTPIFRPFCEVLSILVAMLVGRIHQLAEKHKLSLETATDMSEFTKIKCSVN